MNVGEILFRARVDVNTPWRAHSVAMRGIKLLSQSAGAEPQLVAALQISKGFDPEFDAEAGLADLSEDLQWVREEGIEWLRRNCLLGTASGFEAFVKKVAAALTLLSSAEAERGLSASQMEIADAQFDQRFAKADAEWWAGKTKFLRTRFHWLESEVIQQVADVLWVRNQFAHNDGIASEDRSAVCLDKPVSDSEKIFLSGPALARCIRILRGCADKVIERTPYLDAI